MIDFTFDFQRFDDDSVTISNLSSLGKYAKDGDYYELTSGTYNITGSVALDKPIVIPSGATVTMIFSSGKKFSKKSNFSGGDIKSLIQIQGNGSLTLTATNTTPTSSTGVNASSIESAISIVNSTAENPATLILNNNTSKTGNPNFFPNITGKYYGIKANSAANITINGGYVSATTSTTDKDGSGIYQKAGKLTIQGTQPLLYGKDYGVYLESGELEINITTKTNDYIRTDNNAAAGVAVNIGSGVKATISGDSKVGATSNLTALKITITSETGGSVTINGGSFNASTNEGNAAIDNESINVTVNITGGSFSQALTGTSNYNISGGSFSTDISNYVSDEMKPYALTVDGKTTFYTADNYRHCKNDRFKQRRCRSLRHRRHNCLEVLHFLTKWAMALT